MRHFNLLKYSGGKLPPPFRRSKAELKLRLYPLTLECLQEDRLRLNLGLNDVVYSEYGSLALDHLSTLIQFFLLSPSDLRSLPLLLSIPPLRKKPWSRWVRLSLPLRLSCGKRIRLCIRRSPRRCLLSEAAKRHLNDAICFLRRLYPVPIGAGLPWVLN
jgi:hypothetical protein